MISRHRAVLWVLVGAVLALLATQAGAQATITLTFMHFNDDYQLGPVDGGKAGGLDRLASVIKRIRAEDSEAQLLFAGDLISPSIESSIFRGAQMIDGLNALNVSAAVLGNHEFDLGPAVLQQRLAESRFPWLGTNVYQADFSRVPRLHTTLAARVRGIDVGYFGLLTRDTLVSSSPGPNIRIMDEVGTARAIVPILQRNGARVIVGVTHIHMHEDQQILREVPGIHFIAGGHEHDPLRATVGQALVAKAGSDARWLGVVRMRVTPDGRVMSIADELITINESTSSDAAVAALVKRYADQMSRELDVVIGRTSVELDARNTAVRGGESPLGNFIADVMRRAVEADVAITNGGGIRTNALFPAGEIKRRDVVSWLPFGNVIVKVRMTGEAIRAALENGVSQVEALGGRFPQVSGLTFTYSRGRPAGSRITAVTIGGRLLDPAAFYTMATNDFMANGGDGYATIKAGEVVIGATGGPVMANTVIDAIRQAGTIAPRTEGRITAAP